MTKRKLPSLKPLYTERMQQLLPDKKDYENYLKILKQLPVKSIRCNTIKISPAKLKKRLKDKNWKIKQPFKDFPEIMIVEGKIAKSKLSDVNDTVNNEKPTKQSKIPSSINYQDKSRAKRGNLIDLEPGELGRALEHLLGYYYIQEIASMLPILVLNPKPNETILDLCSAPGSKTTQAGAKMKNTGLIVANEVKLGRIKILATNLQRCGITNTIITKKDGVALCNKLSKEDFKFDKILVDAPCSGEGTLRSSPKTYVMWNPKKIKSLSRIQKNLIDSAIKLLKPKGEMVYSTCTHAPEENEEIVNYVLENFPDMKIEKISLPLKTRQGITKWKDKEYNEEVKTSCRIYPQDNNTEGFFIARFKKK